MSNPASAWAWLQDIPPTAKLILLKLADNADEWGYCYPGQKYVAERTGLAKRTVIAQIKWLETEGYLIKAKRERGNKSSTSNGYTLQLQGAGDAPIQNETGATDAPKSPDKVQEMHPEGAGDAPPQPSTNPQLATPSFVQFTMDTLESVRGYAPGNYGAEAKAIKEMEKIGYTTVEIIECYVEKKKDVWWKEKPLTMMSVKSAIGEWKKHQVEVPVEDTGEKYRRDAERLASRPVMRERD